MPTSSNEGPIACSSEYASGNLPIGSGGVTADDEHRSHPGRAEAGDHVGDLVLVEEQPGRQVRRDAYPCGSRRSVSRRVASIPLASVTVTVSGMVVGTLASTACSAPLSGTTS